MKKETTEYMGEDLNAKIVKLYRALQAAKAERRYINVKIRDCEKQLEKALQTLETFKEPNLFNQEETKKKTEEKENEKANSV